MPADLSPSGVTGAGTGSGSPSSSGGSPSPSPSPSSSSSAGAPSGTGAPGSTAAPASQPLPEGQPVPWDRFSEVNGKYSQLRWAEEHDPEEVGQAVQLRRWFDTDPEGAYEYVTGLMKRGGYIKPPQAPNGNGNGQGQNRENFAADGRPLPDIIIRETGQRFFSAEQAERLVEWKAQALDERLKSIEGRQTAGQAQNEARRILQDAQTNWEGFKDFAPEIFKEMQRDRRITLETAYRRIVVPKLATRQREIVMQELQGKAAAGTGTNNPGAAGAQSTAELQKLPLSELFKREMRKRGIGR